MTNSPDRQQSFEAAADSNQAAKSLLDRESLPSSTKSTASSFSTAYLSLPSTVVKIARMTTVVFCLSVQHLRLHIFPCILLTVSVYRVHHCLAFEGNLWAST